MRFAGRVSDVAGATQILAQEKDRGHERDQDSVVTPVQIVALDECDPKTFNDALGADFCHNVTLGKFTMLLDLFKQAKAGTPDPNWDFEPDTLRIKKGTPIIVTDQGGEPHTFTEVERFGGGFIPDLNGPGRGNRSGMRGRLREPRSGENSHSAGQPAADYRPGERRAPLSVLHSSVDASEG